MWSPLQTKYAFPFLIILRALINYLRVW